ncbi:glycosyltransferase family 4 protein [Fundicoccus sp. Sow4_D5]|uniref:glycosyltransferase family 4 protein n=1 Tax=Fundicoccus sp. Sow4_D5 TaxID=3438782 RepID=UPI003F8EAE85
MATVVKLHVNVFHIPLLKMMKDKGYEVHVCSKNDFNEGEQINIPYCDKFFNLPFDRNPLSIKNIKAYKKLKTIIDYNDYDIIHCHTPVGGALTRLAAKEARKQGCKVVYTAHGFHFYSGAPVINWLVYYPIEKILSKHTDALLTINEEDYKRAKKMKTSNIFKISGVGIDLDKFRKNNSNGRKFKRELGINEDDSIIISVGELNENKNHSVIIKALSKIKSNSIYYIICGQGHMDKSLLQLATKLNVENNIKLVGFQKNINNFLDIADVYVFPSIREGLSLSLMEAMANSLPIIASDIRGNKDLIDDLKGGYLVNPENSTQIAERIEQLLTDNKLSNEYGKYNFEKVQNYSINNVLTQIEKIYSALE